MSDRALSSRSSGPGDYESRSPLATLGELGSHLSVDGRQSPSQKTATKGRSGSAKQKIPLSFKTVRPPASLLEEDFKADRLVDSREVAREMQHNMNEYIRTLNFELALANKLKKAIDDVASLVETGAMFNKEIAGASVVDMQVLLFNTRQMNNLKDKYVNKYKQENNEMQTTARRVRNEISQQMQNPTYKPDGSMPLPKKSQTRSNSAMSNELSATRSSMELDLFSPIKNSITGCPRCSSAIHATQKEIEAMRKKLIELESQ
mmetsp:Transcript_14229/g.34800  ORF Transcript_14229/g.34800 Transcript_14229/m.34800 type:complete len:262 (-) Transcript_14229:1091-1876(-)